MDPLWKIFLDPRMTQWKRYALFALTLMWCVIEFAVRRYTTLIRLAMFDISQKVDYIWKKGNKELQK